MNHDFDNLFHRLAKSKFRSRFKLSAKELAILESKGMSVIRTHAKDLIAKRLAPSHPANDGKQTPFRGHPVFVAQHATATCCRTCLYKWHGIAKGKELSDKEIEYVLDVIQHWLAQQQTIASER